MLFITSAKIIQSKNDYTGIWVLDSVKSELTRAMPALPKTIKITDSGKVMVFEKDTEQFGKVTTRLTPNTPPIEIKILTPGYRKWGELKYSEPNGLEISTEYKVGKDDQGNPEWSYHRTESYKLSASGDEMTYIDVAVGPKGHETFKGVYTKKL